MGLVSEYKNKQLTIFALPVENARKVMKVKIFLNSSKILSYCFNDNNLVIDFKIDDETVIAKETPKIISFIESTLGCEVVLDNYVSDKINEVALAKESFDSSIKTLRKLKNDGIDSDSDYVDYCNFCDSTLTCKLRPYQYSASFYLTIGNGGFDFSVPGSGKTIITYAAYNFLKAKNKCTSILIIGPINSFNAWFDEYYTCFGTNPDFTSLANMSKNESSTYLLSSPKNHSEITFVNVDKAWRLKNEIIDFLKNKDTLLVIDEAHKEKNPDAEITKAVLEITKYVKSRIILTGTPMPNGYEDLYSLMKIYEPYERVLPYTYYDLKKMTKNGADEHQQGAIMNSISPLYSRVSKKHLIDTKELLPANFRIIPCSMSQEQREIYEFLNTLAYEIDDDFESALNVNLMRAVLIRKMQVSANPGLLSKSIISSIEEYREEYSESFDKEDSDNEALLKADNELRKRLAKSKILSLVNKFDTGYAPVPKNQIAVELALEIIAKGEKVILWEVFVQNMNTLKSMIEQKYSGRVEIINGTIGGQDRQDAINRFKKGDSMVMIANPATLAESVSLHRACQNAIYVNRNFNAAQFIQSKDRIHRINMPLGKTANYYFLVNTDSVDESVHDRLMLKENRMLKILDSNELVIGGSEFENAEFMSLEDVKAALKK